MVPHAVALRRGGLDGADIHSAVDEHGVGVDDLGRGALVGEAVGQGNRETGLAHGGRPTRTTVTAHSLAEEGGVERWP